MRISNQTETLSVRGVFAHGRHRDACDDLTIFVRRNSQNEFTRAKSQMRVTVKSEAKVRRRGRRSFVYCYTCRWWRANKQQSWRQRRQTLSLRLYLYPRHDLQTLKRWVALSLSAVVVVGCCCCRLLLLARLLSAMRLLALLGLAFIGWRVYQQFRETLGCWWTPQVATTQTAARNTTGQVQKRRRRRHKQPAITHSEPERTNTRANA